MALDWFEDIHGNSKAIVITVNKRTDGEVFDKMSILIMSYYKIQYVSLLMSFFTK